MYYNNITMANLTDLNTLVGELFTVIGTLITNIVDLMTGDLVVLVVVGAFITLIVGIILLLLNYVKNTFNSSMKTRYK